MGLDGWAYHPQSFLFAVLNVREPSHQQPVCQSLYCSEVNTTVVADIGYSAYPGILEKRPLNGCNSYLLTSEQPDIGLMWDLLWMYLDSSSSLRLVLVLCMSVLWVMLVVFGADISTAHRPWAASVHHHGSVAVLVRLFAERQYCHMQRWKHIRLGAWTMVVRGRQPMHELHIPGTLFCADLEGMTGGRPQTYQKSRFKYITITLLQPFYGPMDCVQDYPGEPVPER